MSTTSLRYQPLLPFAPRLRETTPPAVPTDVLDRHTAVTTLEGVWPELSPDALALLAQLAPLPPPMVVSRTAVQG
jgi:hypothetical protein